MNYTKKTFGADANPIVNQRLDQFSELDREGARGGGFARTKSRRQFEAEQQAAAGRKTTNTSSLFPDKKGGGGGKSDEEQAQAKLERYIETLMRQNSVLDAEIATFGKSNAEKRAAVELAKAQVDLAKLDEDARQKIIASLTKEIELSEQKRTKLAELKTAQQGLNDAQKYFGNAAVDALEDLIFNGAKAEDVVKNLTKSLAQAAIKALLLGEGPLAGLFGTKTTDGSAGGLFGSLLKGATLFGKATGGGVNAGQAYRVGERGPETFVPTVPGQIVPNAGRSGAGNTSFIINAPGADRAGLMAVQAELRQLSQSFNTRVAGANRVSNLRGVRPY